MSNQPRFEVFPVESEEQVGGRWMSVPRSVRRYCWHFRDANGRITFTGGESFTRREDAHRALKGAAADVLCLAPITEDHKLLALHTLPIVDLDEKGDVIGAIPEESLTKGMRDARHRI